MLNFPCYTLQLKDARASSIANIAGKCANSDAFADLINEATRRLMKRGGWWNTELLLKICAYGCEITWPRFVGTVLGVRPCGSGSAMMRNQWWNIVGPANCLGGWATGTGWQGGTVTIMDETPGPTYNEVTGNTGKIIQYSVVKNQDYGKTIRLFGFQYGNQPLQEKDANGNWVMGLTLTAANPYGRTTTLVTKITSVTREQTQGMTYLYEVDALGNLHDLAEYQPTETNPQYRRSKIQNMCGIPYFTDAYERKVRKLEALIKLEYIPVQTDDDFLMISSLDALKFAIQAIRAEEAQDFVQAKIAMDAAILDLNMELRDRFPSMQTSIVMNATSSDCSILSAY